MKASTTYTEHRITIDPNYNPLVGRTAGKSFANMTTLFKSVPYEVKVLRTKIKKGIRKGKTRTIIVSKPKNIIDNLNWLK